jgi:hypothetical protein
VKRFLTVTAALAALATLLLVLPFGAGANSDKRFVLSWRGAFTGDTTGAGTFAMGGSLNDSGTFTTSYSVGAQKGNCSLVTGDATFTDSGGFGSFSEHYEGLSCSGGSNWAPFDGRFVLTGGTGVYAGLSGKGTITSLADFLDGTFTGIHDGRVSSH